MPFVALLDANVLWSAPLRDTLLRACEHRLYRAIWTREILDEVTRNLKVARPDLPPSNFDRLADRMISEFPDALVTNYETLVPTMTNNKGDRHVLAAAVRGGAAVIVTWNGKHFLPSAQDTYDIDVQSPDEFLCHLWHLKPDCMAEILKQQSDALANPPKTCAEVVEILRKQVPTFAETAASSSFLSEFVPTQIPRVPHG